MKTTATGRWLYTEAGPIQLLDGGGTVRAYAWFKRPYWLGQVVGRRDREPVALSLNQIQHHLETETGIQPERR